MDLFAENRLIVQRKRVLGKTLAIMDANMKTLGCVRHHHFKKVVAWWMDEVDCTSIRFEGTDGMLIGEMREDPFLAPNRMTLWSVWRITDAKGDFKGAVKERLSRKLIGFRRSVELEDAEGKTIALVKGDVKERDFVVLDVRDEVIARCGGASKDYYVLDLLSSSLSRFLVFCYVLVLDFTTHWYSRGGL